MTATAKALYEFYSSFQLPAWQTDHVPDDATLPYITYLYAEPEYQSPVSHYVQVYMRTNSNTELLGKAGEIVRAIGEGIVLDGGVVIRPQTPLVQIINDEDPNIRRAYINLQLNAFHTPGT